MSLVQMIGLACRRNYRRFFLSWYKVTGLILHMIKIKDLVRFAILVSQIRNSLIFILVFP